MSTGDRTLVKLLNPRTLLFKLFTRMQSRSEGQDKRFRLQAHLLR
jgi:hypothetical protein